MSLSIHSSIMPCSLNLSFIWRTKVFEQMLPKHKIMDIQNPQTNQSTSNWIQMKTFRATANSIWNRPNTFQTISYNNNTIQFDTIYNKIWLLDQYSTNHLTPFQMKIYIRPYFGKNDAYLQRLFVRLCLIFLQP